MAITSTEPCRGDMPTEMAASDVIRASLTTGLAEDPVLHQLCAARWVGDPRSTTTDYRLHLDWRPPHVGAEIALQRLHLSVRIDRVSCPQDLAGPLLQRAAVVLAERATRGDLPIVGISEQHATEQALTLLILYQLPANAQDQSST